MSEITNNFPQLPANNKIDKAVGPKVPEEGIILKEELPEFPSAKPELPRIDASGQSLVKPSDSFSADLNDIVNKPEMVMNANKIFDIAYENLKANGDNNAYVNAGAIADAYKKELTK